MQTHGSNFFVAAALLFVSGSLTMETVNNLARSESLVQQDSAHAHQLCAKCHIKVDLQAYKVSLLDAQRVT